MTHLLKLFRLGVSRLSIPAWVLIGAVAVSLWGGAAALSAELARYETVSEALSEWLSLLGATPVVVSLLGVSATLGILGYNRLLLHRAIRHGEARQDRAIADLQRLIRQRIRQPELLTAHSVRSLLIALETRHRCGVITDKLVVEAIRGAALELEYELTGAALVAALQVLESLRMEFEKNGSPLLSLAVVDRLSAYKYSQPIAMGFLGMLGLALIGLHLWLGYPLVFWPLVIAVLVVMGWLFVASVRAEHYWRPDGPPTEPSLLSRWMRPTRPHWLFDLFLFAALTRSEGTSRFWNQTWGPIWENNLSLFHRQFLRMHEYRYFVAEDTKCQLRQLTRRVSRALRRRQDVSGHIEELAQLHAKMWRVGGDQLYKAQALRLMRGTPLEREQAVRDLVSAGEEATTVRSLKRELRNRQREFYAARLGGTGTNAEAVAILQDIVRLSSDLAQRTDGDFYRRAGTEAAELLDAYLRTQDFFP